MESEPADESAFVNIFDYISSICVAFEHGLKQGNATTIEDCVNEVSKPSQSILYRNLLLLELHHRQGNQDSLSPNEYLARFPEYVEITLRSFDELTTQTKSLLVTSRLGDYHLIRELGCGRFGVVFEATHLATGHSVALKTLPTGLVHQASNASHLEQYQAELNLCAEAFHPSIIGWRTLEVDGNQWFSTMDLVDGCDFQSFVRPNGTFDEYRFRSALPQIAALLTKLHQRDWNHGQLESSKILVGSDGLVSLLYSKTDSEFSRHAFGEKQEGIEPHSDVVALGKIVRDSLRGTVGGHSGECDGNFFKSENLPQDLAQLADWLLNHGDDQHHLWPRKVAAILPSDSTNPSSDSPVSNNPGLIIEHSDLPVRSMRVIWSDDGYKQRSDQSQNEDVDDLICRLAREGELVQALELIEQSQQSASSDATLGGLSHRSTSIRFSSCSFVMMQASAYQLALHFARREARSLRQGAREESLFYVPLMIEALSSSAWNSRTNEVDQAFLKQALRRANFVFDSVPFHQPHILRAAGRAWWAMGNPAQSIQLLEKAVALSAELSNDFELAKSLLDLSFVKEDSHSEKRRTAMELLRNVRAVIPRAEAWLLGEYAMESVIAPRIDSAWARFETEFG